MDVTIWEVKKWRKQKEIQIKRLETLLLDRKQELKNLKTREEELEAVEEAYYIVNQ